jgi:hypothetical protein
LPGSLILLIWRQILSEEAPPRDLPADGCGPISTIPTPMTQEWSAAMVYAPFSFKFDKIIYHPVIASIIDFNSRIEQ